MTQIDTLFGRLIYAVGLVLDRPTEFIASRVSAGSIYEFVSGELLIQLACPETKNEVVKLGSLAQFEAPLNQPHFKARENRNLSFVPISQTAAKSGYC